MRFHRSQSALAALVCAMIALVAVGRALAAGEPVRWKMASAAPGSVIYLGTTPKRFTETLATISGGDFRIDFYEPGALVPPLQMFDSVAHGAIEAAWAPSGFWAGKVKASVLFSAVPFGPSTDEFMAWVYDGGGQALWREILAPHGICSVFCQITPPEASGWFREEIRSLHDLKGLKMRIFGLGALVMQKFGVSTQMLAPGDVYPALERGVIDATEVSMRRSISTSASTG